MGKKLRFPLICFLILVIGYFIWVACHIIPVMRYNRQSSRINHKIFALVARKPDGINTRMWEECVAWASIAHGNICFSEQHASYQAVQKFEKQLDEKPKAEVDLSTIEWIGKRLEETGPNGHRYMNTSIKWWSQWKGILEAIELEKSKP